MQKKKAALSNTTTRSDVEMEITTVDVAYTIGGATLGFLIQKQLMTATRQMIRYNRDDLSIDSCILIS